MIRKLFRTVGIVPKLVFILFNKITTYILTAKWKYAMLTVTLYNNWKIE